MDRRELTSRRTGDPLFRALTTVLELERNPSATVELRRDDGSGRLVDDARRHGVVPILAPHADRLGFGDDAAAQLETAARANEAAASRAVAQLAELDAALRAVEVRMLVLKGVPLAATLTGSAAGRKVGDLDVLVDPDDLPRAQRAIAALGYQPHPEQGDPVDGVHARAIRWLQKDRAFFRSDSVALELHWRLSRYTLLSVTFDELWRQQRTVEVDGVRLPALGDAHGLLHVAVHGADSHFYRYQWAVDVVRSSRAADDATMQAVELLARRHACRNSFALARRIAHRLAPDVRAESPSPLRARGVDLAEDYCWNSVYGNEPSPWQTRTYRNFVAEGGAAKLRLLANDLVHWRITAGSDPLPRAIADSLVGRARERIAATRPRG